MGTRLGLVQAQRPNMPASPVIEAIAAVAPCSRLPPHPASPLIASLPHVP